VFEVIIVVFVIARFSAAPYRIPVSDNYEGAREQAVATCFKLLFQNFSVVT
jgi:hypothetical protein